MGNYAFTRGDKGKVPSPQERAEHHAIRKFEKDYALLEANEKAECDAEALIFRGDNFLQMLPNTLILEGESGLTFIHCNLTNCIPPADSVIVGPNPPIQRSFCSHRHPKWVAKGLPECPKNCSHMDASKSTEVKFNGVVIDTFIHYEDKKL